MDHSTLGKLPPELRIEIFEYVLYLPSEPELPDWDGQELILAWWMTAENVLECDDQGPVLPTWMTANKRQALTFVCREIRAETYKMFYRFDEISFCPKILNKFEPGFFVTDDESKQEMIRDYLGPANKWVEDLSDWLNHMGDDIRHGIKIIDIDIGTWSKTWTSFENPLVEWLTEALAGMVQYFDTSGTQVYLYTLLETKDFLTNDDRVELHLPISDMPATYKVFSKAVREKKDALNYHRYPTLQKTREESYDRCRNKMRAYLEHLETRIKQHTPYS